MKTEFIRLPNISSLKTKFFPAKSKQIFPSVSFIYYQHILQMGLRHVGLKPVIKSQSEKLAPDEVNLQVMPPPDMPPALASKKIDAFIVAEPFNAAGELLAHGKMLRFTGDIWKNHPCCVVCMNENVVKAKPTWTQKVMNAIVRAEVYAQQNKAEVAHMLSKDGKHYLPMPAKVVVRLLDAHISQSRNQRRPCHSIFSHSFFNNNKDLKSLSKT